MNERYLKNYLSEDLQKCLLNKHIGVIGCGGNGGYVIEFLARLGVKEISIWDGDSFEESNLNRQIYCNSNTLGANKALVASAKAFEINPTIIYHTYTHYFSEEKEDFENGQLCDLIITCTDLNSTWRSYRNLLRRLIVQGIPVINNAIIAEGIFIKIYTQNSLKSYDLETGLQTYWTKRECTLSQPAYKCALAASMAINEMVKYFQSNPTTLIDKTMKLDINNNRMIQNHL